MKFTLVILQLNVTCLDWPFKKKTNVCKFETSVVLRNKKDWFAEIVNLQPVICVLQEELAFMYEMLGLFEDALIQYDELDALFTQYILFFAAGSMYYICITYNSSGVTYCKPTFILCKKFLRSWQEPHFCEYFSPLTSIWQIHVLVCGEKYSIFFSKNCFLTA